MSSQIRLQRFLSWLATAALSGLVFVALAAPAGAQASRTRPPSGGSSAGHSSGSSGGSQGGSASVGGSSSSSHRSSSPSAVDRTRPPQSGGSSPTVVERDRRPGGGSYHGYRNRYPYRSYDPFYFGIGFGSPYWGSLYWGSPFWSPYWNWGPYYGGSWWDYGVRYPHAYAGVNVYPSQLSPTMGALDLDLWPAKTEVYVDGQYVGVVDNFDGWPRYLWLEKGTYDVVFYKQGFVTLARQYTVYPGVVIDVGDRMQPGQSVAPEDLISKSTARRDERIAQDREQAATAARAEGDWQRRVRDEREERARSPAEVEAVESGREVDARGEPGRVHVAVEPDDAAVYLDGRFLGTGRELSRLGSGLIVDPGAHRLSVVRPGRESKSVDFTVESGKEVELTVALAATR